MKKRRNFRPERKMKPVFLVFCEGETEEAYINFLKQKYRLPIKIIPYTTGQNISPLLIKKHVNRLQLDRRDAIATFIMYDLDVNDISEKITACKGSLNISSKPCIELWFLLHNVDQFAELSATACIELLRNDVDWKNYKKGMFSIKQKQILWDNRIIACQRAKALPEAANPSSAVYRLIEAMEKIMVEDHSRSKTPITANNLLDESPANVGRAVLKNT